MDLRRNSIICLGSPLIDITARIPYDFLQRYKLLPNDAVSYDEFHRKIFDDLQSHNPTYTVGGSVTLAVRTLQRSLNFSPGACCYIGAVGKDEFGRKIEKELSDEGINVLFEKIDGVSTGRCAVLLNENNRSFVTDLEASKCLNEAFIETAKVKNAIEMGKYYYISAFFFRVSCPIVHKICTHAKEENKTLILNIGAPFLCHEYISEFKKILPYTNILVGNAEECAHLAKLLGCLSKDVSEMASFLYSYSCTAQGDENVVIITAGSDPVTVVDVDGVKRYKVPHAENEKKLNTSGAGDYFAGNFIAQLVLNKSVDHCVRRGIANSCELILKNS